MKKYLNKLISRLPAAILMVVVLTACSQEGEIWRATATFPPPIILPSPTIPPTPTSVPANPLVGTSWTLESFGPVSEAPAVLPDTTLSLSFDPEGRAEGWSGCNDYFVPYEVEDGRLAFDRLFSTRQECEEDETADQEQQFFNALQTGSEFERNTAGQLTIFFDDGEGVLNFVEPNFVAADPTLTPVPTETAVPPSSTDVDSSAENPIRITFARGATGSQIEASIEAGETVYYILEAMAGQQMTVNVISPENNVLLSVIGEDGTVLKIAEDGLSSWKGVLPATQDYSIQVESVGPATTYMLTIEIAPLEA